jgi:hypothetical protein
LLDWLGYRTQDRSGSDAGLLPLGLERDSMAMPSYVKE